MLALVKNFMFAMLPVVFNLEVSFITWFDIKLAGFVYDNLLQFVASFSYRYSLF